MHSNSQYTNTYIYTYVHTIQEKSYIKLRKYSSWMKFYCVYILTNTNEIFFGDFYITINRMKVCIVHISFTYIYLTLDNDKQVYFYTWFGNGASLLVFASKHPLYIENTIFFILNSLQPNGKRESFFIERKSELSKPWAQIILWRRKHICEGVTKSHSICTFLTDKQMLAEKFNFFISIPQKLTESIEPEYCTDNENEML